jgi:hypothetical protein
MIHVPPDNLKGAHGEAQVASDLLSKGIAVFVPIFEGGKTDLLAFHNDNLYRIQVKALTLQKDNSVKLKMKSYDLHVDMIALFLPQTGDILYIPIDRVSKGECTMSVNIKRVGEYKDFPFNSGLKIGSI